MFSVTFVNAGSRPEQRLVALVARAVQRDIESERRLAAEEVQPVGIDQRAVAVDRDHEPHFFQLRQNIPEIRPYQRLAAGQQQEKHPAAARGFRDRKPLVRRQLTAAAALLLRRQMNIAHAAVEIAARGQLKITGQRRARAACLGVKIAGKARFYTAGVHLILSSVHSQARAPRPRPCGSPAGISVRGRRAARPVPSSAPRTPRPTDNTSTGSAAA